MKKYISKIKEWLIAKIAKARVSSYVTAHIRTWTPIAVGYVVTQLAANAEIVISDTTSMSVTLALQGFLTAAYYTLVRSLGRRWPTAERLLGATSTPTYR